MSGHHSGRRSDYANKDQMHGARASGLAGIHAGCTSCLLVNAPVILGPARSPEHCRSSFSTTLLMLTISTAGHIKRTRRTVQKSTSFSSLSFHDMPLIVFSHPKHVPDRGERHLAQEHWPPDGRTHSAEARRAETLKVEKIRHIVASQKDVCSWSWGGMCQTTLPRVFQTDRKVHISVGIDSQDAAGQNKAGI